MTLSYNDFAGRSAERLGSLSDGVFAFAMTLLVLDLRVPVADAIHSEQGLRHALLGLAPNALTWVMSFLTLGIFWVGQHTQLTQIKHSERSLTWIHLAFLLMVTLVPFSTELLAAFITYRTALFIYWLNIVGLGAGHYWSWAYVRRANLIKDDAPAGIPITMQNRIITAQSFYAAAVLLAFINTYLSIAVIILIQLNDIIAPRIGILRRF